MVIGGVSIERKLTGNYRLPPKGGFRLTEKNGPPTTPPRGGVFLYIWIYSSLVLRNADRYVIMGFIVLTGGIKRNREKLIQPPI